MSDRAKEVAIALAMMLWTVAAWASIISSGVLFLRGREIDWMFTVALFGAWYFSTAWYGAEAKLEAVECASDREDVLADTSMTLSAQLVTARLTIDDQRSQLARANEKLEDNDAYGEMMGGQIEELQRDLRTAHDHITQLEEER